MKKREEKKTLKTTRVIRKIKKEIKDANLAIVKAKKEIREAEAAIEKAYEEAFEVAEIAKGKKKDGFTGAVRDLEKATHLAMGSTESTEEAEFKIKPFSKRRRSKW